MFKSKTQRAKQLRRKNFLNFERLEDRSLLAGNVLAIDAAGYMLLIGDSAANEVAITQNANGTLNVAGVGTTINGQASATLGAATRGALILLGEGNDSLSISGTTATALNFGSSTTIELGGGNNNLALSNFRSAGSLTINGGLGNDTITALRAPAATTGFGLEVGGNLVISTLSGNDNINLRNSAVAVVTVVNTNVGDDVVDVRNSAFGHVAMFVGGPHAAGDSINNAGNTFAFPPFVLQFENQTTINAPVAVNDTVPVTVTDPVTPVAFNVLTNDNPNGSAFGTVTIVTPLNPNLGTLTQGANGNFTFTPNANATGTATFTYNVAGVGSGTSNTATVTLNVNQAPTIDAIVDQTTPEETPIAVPIVVADVEGAVTVTATSSNPGVVASIVPNGANTEIVITPALNQPPGTTDVTTTITVTVTDSAGAQVTEDFVLTVTPVNDDPTLTDPADIFVPVAVPLPVSVVTVGDVDTPLASVNVTATSSDQGLIPDANIVITGDPGAVRTITITPFNNVVTGTATITLTADDGLGGTAVQTFDVTISAPPTIDFDPNQVVPVVGLTVDEDTTNDITVTVTNPESPAEAVTVTATSDNQALITDASLVYDPNTGTLAVDPVLNANTLANGTATITVTATDAAGNVTTADFLLTVVPIDDAPQNLIQAIALNTTTTTTLQSDFTAPVTLGTNAGAAFDVDGPLNVLFLRNTPAGVQTFAGTQIASADNVILLTMNLDGTYTASVNPLLLATPIALAATPSGTYTFYVDLDDPLASQGQLVVNFTNPLEAP